MQDYMLDFYADNYDDTIHYDEPEFDEYEPELELLFELII